MTTHETSGESRTDLERILDDVRKALHLLDSDAQTLRNKGVPRSDFYGVGRHMLGGIEGRLMHEVRQSGRTALDSA